MNEQIQNLIKANGAADLLKLIMEDESLSILDRHQVYLIYEKYKETLQIKSN